MTEPNQRSDLGAERAVLASCLLDAECWAAAREMLRTQHFFAPQHADVWRAFEVLASVGSPLDTTTLLGQLETGGKLQRVGGIDAVLDLTATIPIVEHVEEHAQRLRDLATLRAVRRSLATSLAELDGPIDHVPDYLDRAETLLQHACSQRQTLGEPTPMSTALSEFFARQQAQAAQGGPIGHKTGFPQLDWYLCGMVPGELVVCAGRPGMGKTAFALAVAQGVAKSSGQAVHFQSIEMPRHQLIARMLSARGEVDGNRIRSMRLSPDDWHKMRDAAAELEQFKIWIDDAPGVTVLDIRRNARKIKRKVGSLGLVVVDYLQLVRAHTRGESREIQVGDISRELKALAKELDVPVLALASLNRDCEKRNPKDKRPQLSDLRESGAIESDADTVLFLYRDELYNPESEDKGVCEIVIGKQRNGATGIVRTAFRREITRFDSLADHRDDGASFRNGHSNGHAATSNHWQDDA